MDSYEVREDRHLWRRLSTYEWTDDPEAPLKGYLRETSHVWRQKTDIPDGGIILHGYDQDGRWVEVTLEFRDGTLLCDG